MKLPTLSNSVSNIRRSTVQFGGINYSADRAEGELSESVNMSTRKFPYLAPRLGRESVQTFTAPSALSSRDKLIVVDGTDFIYDGEVVGQVTAGEKQIVNMGDRIIIFPDKIVFDRNIKDLTPSYKNLTIKTSLSTPSQSLYVKEEIPLLDGNKIVGRNVIIAGEKFKVAKVTGAAAEYVELTFYETIPTAIGKANNKIKPDFEFRGMEYSVVTLELPYYPINPQYKPTHVKFGTNYIQLSPLSVDGIYGRPFQGFRVGDAVEISGSSEKANNKTAIIRDISATRLDFDAGIFRETPYIADPVKIHRKVPDFTTVCVSNNRLWGCEEHTIYGSKLGDPTNFLAFDGLSTDSYAAAVSSEGEFTACTPFGSQQILFFKERIVHKLYGTEPENYRLGESLIAGVKAGCSKSVITMNDTLFYVARNGVYAYSGGVPQLISRNFGDMQITEAVAGASNDIYYLSACDGEDWHFLVFDSKRGLWTREDEMQVYDFTLFEGELYALSGDKSLYRIDGAPNEAVPWSATLTEFSEQICVERGYSRLHMRVECEAGAWFEVFISEDKRPFRKVFTGHNKTGIISVPILPLLCDSFRIRISGKGKCTIKALEREYQAYGY